MVISLYMIILTLLLKSFSVLIADLEVNGTAARGYCVFLLLKL